MVKFEFEAIGTHWEIDIAKELSSEEEALLLSKIENRIAEFDLAYSRFKQESLVTRMSKEAGDFVMPEDADKMLTAYKKMYDVTGGLVTPLIGQVLVDSGYDEKYSFETKELSRPLSWDGVLEWNKPVLKIKKPALLDFGAGGKGYLVDIVGELLESNDISSYCVDAGGDMRQRGEDLKVGLEHPEDKESVIGAIKIKNQSMCGSAGNRRAWAGFHHVISPETLTSPKEILSVWTVAEDTLTADILTTGLFFVSPDVLLKHFNFEYLILRPDYSIEKSEGFDAEIFT